MTVERLGKNIGGYFGETIGLPKVLQDIKRAAAAKNWVGDCIPLPSSKPELPLEFIAYRRSVESPRRRIYVSAGIHGDEPAGLLAALQLLEEDRWPADVALWLCPCLNPTGFTLNRRENAQGIDLNRDYRHFLAGETRAHVAWLREQPNFDLTLCLHEDWESHGFYVYEVNPDNRPSFAEKMVEAVAKVCPIERGNLVDNWPANNGVIRPQVKPEERPQWPEALYLIMNKTRQSYTLEAPSDFSLSTRVAALVTGVQAVIESL